MSLPDRAVQVLDLLAQNGIGERSILFICHSQGGLLIKQVLHFSDGCVEEKKGLIARNCRAVLFLSTPHTGSTWASVISKFRRIFGATVIIEDLRAHDPHLRVLYNWYRHYAQAKGVQTASYYELRGIRSIFKVVSADAANPGVGADPVGLDEDHFSIAKPSTRNAQVYISACRLLRDHVLSSPLGQPSVPTILSPPSQTSIREFLDGVLAVTTNKDRLRVPKEFPPTAEKFYGRSFELATLTERLLAGRNTGVVGPPGFGKTALAAEALRNVVAESPERPHGIPFPDGLVYIDLYSFHGRAESVWNTIANKLAGLGFAEKYPAKSRATEACRGRQVLVILEGGEEANGRDGRPWIHDILTVLSPENRWLLLTRLSDQVAPQETVNIKEALSDEDAGRLLDSLTQGHISPEVRAAVLNLLEGHPLALNWAGNLIAREEEDPSVLIREWKGSHLPKLTDPIRSEHTLEWLFDRSCRSLDHVSRQAMSAAALLAHGPFPADAIEAGLALNEENLHGAVRASLKRLVQSGFMRRTESAAYFQFSHVLSYRFARRESDSDHLVRERLSRWLQIELAAAFSVGQMDEHLSSPTSVLVHSAALLRADFDQRLWEPLARYVLYHVYNRSMELGSLALANLSLDAFDDWLGRIPSPDQQKSRWIREACASISLRGDVLELQGDLPAALAAHRKALHSIQKLVDSEPANIQLLRDLGVYHSKVGRVLVFQGALLEAQAAHKQSLEIKERLFRLDPKNHMLQGDMAVGYVELGELLRFQGDLKGMLAAFQKSLELIRAIAEADPSVTDYQENLSIAYARVGGALKETGDLPGALEAFQESLAIRDRLVNADPRNREYQRHLSMAHDYLADVFILQGELSKALTSYRESQLIRRKLTAGDQSNSIWKRDLAVSCGKVADVLKLQGDWPGALAANLEGLAIFSTLAALDPSNMVWQRDKETCHGRVGDIQELQGNLSEALASREQGLAIARRLAESNPENAEWQRDLCVSYGRVGDTLKEQRKMPDAERAYHISLTIAQKMSDLSPSNMVWRRDFTLLHARIGDTRKGRGDLEGAKERYGMALSNARHLSKVDPSNTDWQRDVAFALSRLADILESLNKLPEAVQLAEEGFGISSLLASLDSTNRMWQDDVKRDRARLTRLRSRPSDESSTS